jgi:2-amino-4-hydroxy-6-hydroxymethyldihydropteridine diphosphokinase
MKLVFPHLDLKRDREARERLRLAADDEADPAKRDAMLADLGSVAMGHAISWEDAFAFHPNEMRVGIALGSNVGDRLLQLRAGRDAILSLPEVTDPVLCSSVYETEPVGTGPDAGAFLNAVIDVGYTGTVSGLLDALQAIEGELGRPSKRPRNAPRTIDLDVLYVGNLTLSNQEIVIPHPRLHQRRFVLTPLAEVRPELVLPGQQQSVAQLLAALQDSAAVRIFTAKWDA